MERNPLKWPITCIGGVAIILLFSIFTSIAFLLYPSNYSIFSKWVSELGNPIKNPQGAIFFNIGCGLTGSALFLFFFGLNKWNNGKKWRTILLIIAQIIGGVSAFSLILVGVFPEHIIIEHLFWSYLYLLTAFLFIILTTISFLSHPDFIKIIGYFGLVIVGFYAAFFYLAYNNIFIGLNFLLEWIIMLGNFSFIGLITYNMFRLKIGS